MIALVEGILIDVIFNIYHLQTKLQECNVFAGDCLFTGGGNVFSEEVGISRGWVSLGVGICRREVPTPGYGWVCPEGWYIWGGCVQKVSYICYSILLGTHLPDIGPKGVGIQ